MEQDYLGNKTKQNKTKQNKTKQGEEADHSDTPETKASLWLPVYLPGEKKSHNKCCTIKERFSEETPEIRTGLEV